MLDKPFNNILAILETKKDEENKVKQTQNNDNADLRSISQQIEQNDLQEMKI